MLGVWEAHHHSEMACERVGGLWISVCADLYITCQRKAPKRRYTAEPVLNERRTFLT